MKYFVFLLLLLSGADAVSAGMKETTAEPTIFFYRSHQTRTIDPEVYAKINEV